MDASQLNDRKLTGITVLIQKRKYWQRREEAIEVMRVTLLLGWFFQKCFDGKVPGQGCALGKHHEKLRYIELRFSTKVHI